MKTKRSQTKRSNPHFDMTERQFLWFRIAVVSYVVAVSCLLIYAAISIHGAQP